MFSIIFIMPLIQNAYNPYFVLKHRGADRNKTYSLTKNGEIEIQSAFTSTTYPFPPPSIIVEFLSSPVRLIVLSTSTFS